MISFLFTLFICGTTTGLQTEMLNAKTILEYSSKEVTAIDTYLQKNGYKFTNQANPDGAGFEYIYDYANAKGETFEVVANGGVITQFIFDLKNQESSLQLLEEFKNVGYMLEEKDEKEEKYKKEKNKLTYKKVGNVYDFNLRFL